jgi:hypothetical protein
LRALRLAVIEPHATRRDLAVHKFDCARTVTAGAWLGSLWHGLPDHLSGPARLRSGKSPTR